MRKLSEYKEPNIMELLWSLFIQWKGVLIVAVICGLLGMGLFYVRDSRSAAAGIPEEVQLQTSVQNQTDLIAVNSILNQEAAVADYQEYYTSSVLMKVDPYHMPVRILHYHIVPADDSADGTAQAIANAYCSDATIYRIAEKLKEAWQSEADTGYLAELVQAACTDTSGARNADFSVRVIVPEQMDASAVDQAVDAAFETVSPDLSGKLSSYTLTRLSSADIVEADAELAETQRDYLKEAGELERVLALSRNQMTDSQKKLYAQLKDSPADDNVLLRQGAADESAAPSMPAPHLSKKGFAYGFVFGIIIYIVLYLLCLIFSRRIQSPAKVKDVLGYHTIGELYVFPYHSGIKRLFASKAVYSLHHRSKTDPVKQLDEMCTAIVSLCGHYGVKTLCLAPLGKQPALAAEYINTLLQKTEQSGDLHISRTALYADGKVCQADRELADAESVIPVIFMNATTDAMIDAVSETCRIYNIRIPGAVYLEC